MLWSWVCCECIKKRLPPPGPRGRSFCQHQHLCSCKVKWIGEWIQLNTNPRGKKKKKEKKSLFSAGSVPQPGRAAFGAEDTCLCAWAGSTGSVMPGLVLWHHWLAPPSKRLSGLVLIYHHFNVWCHRGYHAGFHPQNHGVAFCRVCWGCSRFPH